MRHFFVSKVPHWPIYCIDKFDAEAVEDSKMNNKFCSANQATCKTCRGDIKSYTTKTDKVRLKKDLNV